MTLPPQASCLGTLVALIVVDRDLRAITTAGRTRCWGLRRWPESEGDDVAGSMSAWAAEKR